MFKTSFIGIVSYCISTVLELLKRTDSQYCISSLTNWYQNWQRKAEYSNDGVWRNRKGEPIRHQEIFENILRIHDMIDVSCARNYTVIMQY